MAFFSKMRKYFLFIPILVVISFINPIGVDKYIAGSPIWPDRPYSDELKNRVLDGSRLVKTRRHQKSRVWVISLGKMEVFRAVPEKSEDVDPSWSPVKEGEILFSGVSQKFTKLFKRTQSAGIHSYRLGQKASSPIFIRSESSVYSFSIERWGSRERFLFYLATYLLIVSALFLRKVV